MDQLLIAGPARLAGTVAVAGSKNASLPIMAASILAGQPVRLTNVPRLADVATMLRVLEELGVAHRRDADGAIELETVDSRRVRAGYRFVGRMRASFCVLGPLLARRKEAVVSLPGGCRIGPRPVDLHLAGLAALGAEIRIRRGYVIARAKQLRGAEISLRGPFGPTVTGTANVMSAAALAQGTTRLHDAAREPEIIALGNFLISLGAVIRGLGTSTIEIDGVPDLGGASWRMPPDRIEVATLLIAAAMTRGEVRATGTCPQQLSAVLDVLRAAGACVEAGADCVTVSAPDPLRAIDVLACPYPGIPTDVQAQLMSLAAVSRGTSRIRDAVFPQRLAHVAELARLGAEVRVLPNGEVAVTGRQLLAGAKVTASDLRASAALVLAGLAAEGPTVIRQSHHLLRGYEDLAGKLCDLGAEIARPVPRRRRQLTHR